MFNENVRIRAVRLPADIEIVLYLIREDLKNAKLMNGLSKIGFSDCPYRSYHGSIVLPCIGFEELNDALHEFYIKLIDQNCELIEDDSEEITRRAMNVYVELMSAMNCK